MWKAIIRHNNGTIDEIGVFPTRDEAIVQGENAMGLINDKFICIPNDSNFLEIRRLKKLGEFLVERLELWEVKE